MSLSIAARLGSLPQLSRFVPANSDKTVEDSGQNSVEAEFLEIARKSPAERMRDRIMEQMGVDPEQLAQMEPEARQSVEDEIKRRMMEALQASPESGQVIDKSA